MLTKYYIIKPTDSLATRARASSYEWAELLTQTVLWSKREGDKTSWADQDRVTLVKLLFLASVSEYANLPGFREIVGCVSFDTSFFDNNWTLQEIDEAEDVADVAKRLAVTTVTEQIHTGNSLVDDWLRHFRSSG